MKAKRSNRLLSHLASSALLATSSLHAATFYWDINGNTTVNTAATGTWTAGSTANWSTAAAGSVATGAVTTTNADDLIFSATGMTTATITVNGTQNAHSIMFSSAEAFTVSGGTAINLGNATAGSGIFKTSSSAQTMSTGIILNSAATTFDFQNRAAGLLTIGPVTGDATTGTQTVNVGTFSTGGITLSGAVADGTEGGIVALTVNSSGTGVTTLSAVNTYTGATTIKSGTLTLNRQTGSLSASSALTFTGSGTFNMDNIGAAGALSQTLGALTFSVGDGTVRTTRTVAQNQTITFDSLAARATGATGNFVNGGGTNGATNGITFTTAPTAEQLIDRGLFFNGSAYAAYDSGGFVRALLYNGTEAMTALSGNANTTLGSIDSAKSAQFNGAATTSSLGTAQAAGFTTMTVASGAAFKVGQAITGAGITANTFVTGIAGNVLTLSQAAGAITATQYTPYNSISAQTTGSVNTLHLAGNGAVLSLSAGETLSINGILRTGHTANVFSGINGGTGIQTVASGGEMVIRTDLSTDTLFIATPILDNGGSSLTKTGAGTLNLTGANTYNGSTYVNAGTLTGSGIRTASTTYVESGATILPSANASFTLLHLRGGTLNASSSGIGGTMTLASNTTSLLTSGGTTTLSANIGGTGNLTVNTNSRQLYLTGNNNYSGTTTLLTPVGTGAVVFGTPGSLYNGDTTKWTPSNITVASGAALGIRGGNGTTTGFSSAQVSTLLGNMATSNNNGLLAGSNIFFDANGGFNYSGAITDSTGPSGGAVGVQFYGATLTLSGNNTYTGQTVFRPYNTGGVGLSVASFNSVNNGNPLLASSSLGRPTSVANGTIQMGTDSFQSSHTLTYTGSGETTDRVLNINGNGSSIMTISQSGSGLLKFTSPVTKNGSATNYTPFTLTGAGNGEFATGLPGFGNFTKSGNGTWTIGGAYGSTSATGTAGVKTISAGTLVFRAGGLNPTGNTTISGASTAFIYNAASDAILTIGGSATSAFTLTGGTSTTIGGSIGSTTTSSRINVNSGTTASASGNIRVNIYGINGVTPVAGTNNYVLLQSNATTNTLTGGTYSLGTVYNNTNFTVGSTIGETANTVTASITQVAALTGNVFWKGGLTGNTAVWAASNGSTDSNWATDLAGTATALVPGSGADVVIATTTPTTSPTATTLGSDMSINSLTISNTVGLGLNASLVDSYKLTIGTGGITMGSSTAASTIAVPLGLGGNQTWTNNSATNALTVSGIVSGTGNLIIAGSGLVNLNGNNIYSGTTTVNSGATLKLGSIIALGTTAGNTTIASGGTIDLNGQTITGETFSITGNGVGGNGALINNSATAAAVIGTITGPFRAGGSGDMTLSSVTTGASLTKVGNGTLTLSGSADNISTAITVTTGTVVLAKASSAAVHAFGGNASVGSGATMQLGGTGDNQIFGGSNLLVSSGGVLDLNGRNQNFSTSTFSQAGNVNLNGTGISSGGALINSDAATTSTLTLGTGSIVLQSDSSIGGVGNITIAGGTTPATGAISGNFSLTKVGAGTVSISSASTYTGATNVDAGTLVISATGSLASGSAVTVSNNGSALVVNGTVNGTVNTAAGTTLSGTGTIIGSTTIAGIHNPGSSPGIQTFGDDLTYNGGSSVVNLDLDSYTNANPANPNALFDQMLVTGDLNFAATTTVNLVFNGVDSTVDWSNSLWNDSQSWLVYDVTGEIIGFDNLELNVTDWLDGDDNPFLTDRPEGTFFFSEADEGIYLNYTVVPEPSTALLGGIGLIALLRRRRK